MPDTPFQSTTQDELARYANQEIPLQSTTIRSVNYNPDTQALDVTFVSGREYTLDGVPPDVFLALLHAPSAGQYFNKNMRGRY
jgi:lysyl-tRNA synthetase class 2